MSDFIKVNYEAGYEEVIHKTMLILSCRDSEGGCCRAKHAADNDLFARDYITREEYDRLCKELGVE